MILFICQTRLGTLLQVLNPQSFQSPINEFVYLHLFKYRHRVSEWCINTQAHLRMTWRSLHSKPGLSSRKSQMLNLVHTATGLSAALLTQWT